MTAHEERTAELETLLRQRIKSEPQEPWVEPVKPPPHDLTHATGQVYTGRAMSVRRCENCAGAIHYGWPRVNHKPVDTSHVTYFYHPECVVTDD